VKKFEKVWMKFEFKKVWFKRVWKKREEDLLTFQSGWPTGPSPRPRSSPPPLLLFSFSMCRWRTDPTCQRLLLLPPPAPLSVSGRHHRREDRRACPRSLASPSILATLIKAIIRPRSSPFNPLLFLPFPYPLYTRTTRRPSMARPPATTPPSASPSSSLALLKSCKSSCPSLSLSHSISPCSSTNPTSVVASASRHRWRIPLPVKGSTSPFLISVMCCAVAHWAILAPGPTP
jgi:hypothetical protein